MEQIDALLEGSITPDEFKKLQATLRSNEKARWYYAEQADLHGRLQCELAPPKESLTQPATQSPFPIRKRKPGRIVLAAAAALALFAGVAQWMGNTAQPAPTQIAERPAPPTQESTVYQTNPDQSAARVTNATNAEWSGGTLELGQLIKPGTFELLAGTAEITFDSGARIVLKSPATLRVVSAYHAKLEYGQCTAEIPDYSDRFTLATPCTKIVENNCRFAIKVARDGSTEIHVLSGLIEATPTANPTIARILNSQQAARLTRENISSEGDMDFDRSKFLEDLNIPEGTNQVEYVYWSFDKMSPFGGFPDEGEHIGPKLMAKPLATPGSDPNAKVTSVNGIYGRAIRLDGDGAFLSSAFQGIPGTGPRTISMWVKLDPDTTLEHAYSMIAWGLPFDMKGQKWQLCWNPDSLDGQPGAIRTEFGGGYVVGSTDLRDGRWHHIVSVFLGSNDDNIANSIRHYVDGKLEAVTSSAHQPINTDLDSPESRPTYIGRRLEDDGLYSTFKGDLDEIRIFPAALTPKQVERLYRSNLPPSYFVPATE
ncbi:LamG domain-containing protein [Sulfuriroseicoccus oceanibius]|uniref:LamG domain-containing protein n=1 Tax=Sulfuriroseicoccus oceanibius TaxID=2707525 RepID=A0A6B3LFW6_9BACT|nr:LamG domain-containing protein [Sulfuriroseicoccus oceanibius]QQL44825.1 LamG domain-containing protein [Sulfuriroseicoccus oceanibius]